MGPHTDARLSAAEGRRFALILALGFVLLAGIGTLRSRAAPATIFAFLSATFVVCAIAIPRRLGPLRVHWMRLGDFIGSAMRPVVLGLLYAVVLTPAGLLRRRIGTSPLSRNRNATSYWIPLRPLSTDELRRDMEHMF